MADKGEVNKISEIIGYIFTRLTDQSIDNLDQYFKTKMRQELEEAGFNDEVIDSSMNWLNSLLEQQLLGFLRSASVSNFPSIHSQQAVRCYSIEERLKLSSEVRGLLFQLEQDGMLDWITREIVITQLMKLDQASVELDDFYWVVFMVACSSISKVSRKDQREPLKRLLAAFGKVE